ncbi:nuclear transport factor 2 family protein [Nocardia sp. CA-135953]|uniref:nuclear transport factor 2 family protein n=1 Tax=Nocardia sp. CA-135953 TaxID=3239978 RepID=UPI003D9793FC
MDSIERLLIERDCTQLSVDYGRLVDFGQAAKVAELFTDDGVCELSAGRFEGIEQIRAFFEKRQGQTDVVSRHVMTNIAVEVQDADHATGLVYLTFYRVVWTGEGPAPLGPPSFVGSYADSYRRTPEGWRFESRIGSTALKS